ncbi:MAG: SDR family oxidoreductase [Acidimicrobiales bacterium]
MTGAFSYSGRAITARLLESGRSVRTLTGHPERAPAGTPVAVRPLDFADRRGLRDSLDGVTTLYNTYWVRFAWGTVDHDAAVANSRALFEAARDAGVRRIVHVSITNPSSDSPFSYFRGKAEVERIVAGTGVSHAIVRPAVLFGGDGVLLNNIAWLLRRLPVFAVGGDGRYRLRPIHIDDLARLCVRVGDEAGGNVTVDAVGPERPTFRELVDQVGRAIGCRRPIVSLPGCVIPAVAGLVGVAVRDVLLTADEYQAMAAGLADTPTPATGDTRLSEWLAAHGANLGTHYAHEIDRHFSSAHAA